jgi:hypothetical protein
MDEKSCMRDGRVLDLDSGADARLPRIECGS